MINRINAAIATVFFAAMAPSTLLAQSVYPVNFDESTTPSRTDRYTKAINLASSDGSQTIQVNQLSENLLYIKRLDDCFVAKAGETVTAGFDYNGGWMCGYTYIDFGKDGKYDVEYTDKKVTNMQDLTAYSFYKDVDSKGASVSGEPKINPPSFTIPAGTTPGIYRMRYKIDWDNVDPGGNMSENNNLRKNGGVVVDTRINVHGEKAHVKVNSTNGTLVLADGNVLTESDVEFGKDLVVSVTANEGYTFNSLKVRHGYGLDGEEVVDGLRQWQENRIMAYAIKDGKLTIPASYIDGDVEISVSFAAGSVETGSEYALNFDKELKQADPTAQMLTEVSLTNAAGQKQTIAIPEGDTVYRNALESEVAAKPGETLTPSIAMSTPSQNVGSYLYIDLDQNGAFSYALTDEGIPADFSELVAFSSYNGKNSAGQAGGEATQMPSFTLPEDLPAGIYRARLKVDTKSNVDPAGEYSETAEAQRIDKANGYIIDFLLNVHGEKGKLEVDARGGHIVGYDNSGVAETVQFGKDLDLMALAPAEGYKVKSVTVRHGYNLDGEQYVHGNRQWEEYTVEDVVDNEDEFSVPAAKVNGDVRVKAQFEADGTEEYKLKFADEFDGEDYSLPNADAWHNCTRENPTWKRFTSQTPEGQQATAFIRDGKLVTRAIKNTIAEEGNVDMISGAIESSDKMYFTYGRIEGRLRTTPHTGNFPAFWLMPQDNSAGWPNAGEIDIWEQIDTENKTYHTVHTHVTYDLHQALPNSGSAYTNAADYHIIALDWTPELLTWSVDGSKIFSYAKSTNQSLLDQGQWPYDKPFYVILNQSVGNGTWAKPCDVNFEYETLFDYVRVYQKDGEGDIVTTIDNVDAKAASLDVYPREGGVQLVTAKAQEVNIYNISGARVFAETVQGNKFVALAKGVYVVNGEKLLIK